MAPLSNSEMGLPSGPSGSVRAGILLLGLMARKFGANCSPTPMSTGWTRYARRHSSSMMCTLWPLGVGHEYTSIIGRLRQQAAPILRLITTHMVVKQVKHWLVTRANASRWRPIMDWADARGAEFSQTRDGQG